MIKNVIERFETLLKIKHLIFLLGYGYHIWNLFGIFLGVIQQFPYKWNLLWDWFIRSLGGGEKKIKIIMKLLLKGRFDLNKLFINACSKFINKIIHILWHFYFVLFKLLSQVRLNLLQSNFLLGMVLVEVRNGELTLQTLVIHAVVIISRHYNNNKK